MAADSEGSLSRIWNSKVECEEGSAIIAVHYPGDSMHVPQVSPERIRFGVCLWSLNQFEIEYSTITQWVARVQFAPRKINYFELIFPFF